MTDAEHDAETEADAAFRELGPSSSWLILRQMLHIRVDQAFKAIRGE